MRSTSSSGSGGGIVTLRDDLMSIGFRVGTILLFLACLLVAAWGTVPVESPARLDHIAECRGFLVRTWERKWGRLKLAMFLFVSAFAVAMLGLIVRRFAPAA